LVNCLNYCRQPIWEERVAAATQARGTITTMTAAAVAAGHTAAVRLNLMTMVAATVKETLPETPVGLPLSLCRTVRPHPATALQQETEPQEVPAQHKTGISSLQVDA